MPNALYNVRAIDDGRFVQIRRNRGQGRYINDGRLAQSLPHAAPDVDVPESAGIGNPIS